ncbi:MAG: alkaline phosphatase family protein [SAR324 cluster bacterium]|nr:alkaline phosphatase family protein [SAR324 cluster bacterium]
MVWDGLRPDMVSEDLTPRLHALAGAGTWFERSHAVVPPVTRCNSAALSTGCLPEHHGIPGNHFVLPRDEGVHLLNAADADDLEQLRSFRNGRVLLRRTLAELVSEAGGHTAIVGTGSPGAALLQHPQVRDAASSGDAIYNHSLWLGSSREDVEAELGPMPEGSVPNTEQNVYFTKLITDLLIASDKAPALITFWHTDPDRTKHRQGVGHPDAIRALRDADRNLGSILDALDATGRADSTNVIVTSDHGFATVAERVDINELLTREIIAKKRAKGERVGHAPFGFTYQNKQLVPVQNELKIVKLIRDHRNQGYSYHKIARYLNDRKISSKRGGIWYAETVKTVYQNTIYDRYKPNEPAPMPEVKK